LPLLNDLNWNAKCCHFFWNGAVRTCVGRKVQPGMHKNISTVKYLVVFFDRKITVNKIFSMKTTLLD
jgi:hypothetical protein